MSELGGIFRAFLAAALGSLVTKGLLSADQLDQIINLVIGITGIIGVAVWSYMTNRLKGMLTTVAASPEVKKIEVTEPDLAESIPSPKVVADPMAGVQ